MGEFFAGLAIAFAALLFSDGKGGRGGLRGFARIAPGTNVAGTSFPGVPTSPGAGSTCGCRSLSAGSGTAPLQPTNPTAVAPGQPNCVWNPFTGLPPGCPTISGRGGQGTGFVNLPN